MSYHPCCKCVGTRVSAAAVCLLVITCKHTHAHTPEQTCYGDDTMSTVLTRPCVSSCEKVMALLRDIHDQWRGPSIQGLVSWCSKTYCFTHTHGMTLQNAKLKYLSTSSYSNMKYLKCNPYKQALLISQYPCCDLIWARESENIKWLERNSAVHQFFEHWDFIPYWS